MAEHERRIVDIDIEELVTDLCNIRGGFWDHDEELIRSVKQRGIELPLLVRPISPINKVKYGIVCGSRRFHASLDAGLDKVPCIIKVMTDIEAMGRSLEENIHRKDIPEWQEIEWIGEMFELLRKDSLRWDSDRKFTSMEARYDEIINRTGLNINRVRDYVRVAVYLPEEVKALLRPRDDRSRAQEERLQRILSRTQSPSETLTLFKALLILNELKGYSAEKQVEFATYILNKTQDISKKLVELVKENPYKNLQELEKSLRKEPDIIYRNIGFDKEIYGALTKACMHKQKKIRDLTKEIVREWLIKNLYLSQKK